MSIVVSGAEYLDLPTPAETYIVEPWLPAEGTALIYGDPKLGKSYLALQLLLAVQMGDPWLGLNTHTPEGPLVYVQLDTPRTEWKERLGHLRMAGHRIDTIQFVDRGTLGAWPLDILNPEHHYKLQEGLRSYSPSVVVIDTLRASNLADENDSTTMQNVVSSLVSATQPAALVIVHHANKPSKEKEPSIVHDARGNTALVGAVDGICKLSGKPKGPAKAELLGRADINVAINLFRNTDGTWRI